MGQRRSSQAFRGYFQTDGYAGYNELFRSAKVKHVACMAHVIPKVLRDTCRSEWKRFWSSLERSTSIEEACRADGLGADECREAREKKARPLFSELKKRIDLLAPPLRQRVSSVKRYNYTLGQWCDMERDLESALIEVVTTGASKRSPRQS